MDTPTRQPSSGPSAYRLGMAAYSRGDYDTAVEQLTLATGRDDLQAKLASFYLGLAHRARGLASMRAGRYAHAAGALRSAIGQLGYQPELAGELGGLLVRSGNEEGAAGVLERAAAAPSAPVSTHRMLALTLWRCGRRTEAIMTLTRAARRFASPIPPMQLALFHAAEGDLDAAREQLHRALDADCTHPRVHYLLGMVAAAQERVPAAVGHLQRAYALAPHKVLWAYQLSLAAQAARQQGRRVVLELPRKLELSGTAGERLVRYVTEDPEFVEALISLPPDEKDAELCELLSGVLSAAISEHPDYADLRCLLSRLLQRLGRSEAALHHALRALEINPCYINAVRQAAALAEGAGDPRTVEALQTALAAGGHRLPAALRKRVEALANPTRTGRSGPDARSVA